MDAISTISERYARCIQTSKKVRWDIDEDVAPIRYRYKISAGRPFSCRGVHDALDK
jgi:hypothetical protein